MRDRKGLAPEPALITSFETLKHSDYTYNCTHRLYHIETVNYHSILCKLFWYNVTYILGVYDLGVYYLGVYDLLTLGVHARKGCSPSFVICLSVCMSVTTSLAHLVAKSLKFGHR